MCVDMGVFGEHGGCLVDMGVCGVHGCGVGHECGGHGCVWWTWWYVVDMVVCGGHSCVW